MADIMISELVEASQLTAGALLYYCPVDAQTESGFDSQKITAQVMAKGVLSDLSFPLIFTKTTAKSAAGAINELAPTVLTGTLLAGNTTLTISDPAIETTCKFRFLSDTWGLYPSTEPVISSGSITLTFEAQDADCNIMVEVRN